MLFCEIIKSHDMDGVIANSENNLVTIGEIDTHCIGAFRITYNKTSGQVSTNMLIENLRPAFMHLIKHRRVSVGDAYDLVELEYKNILMVLEELSFKVGL
jgi:hypothetical protein